MFKNMKTTQKTIASPVVVCCTGDLCVYYTPSHDHATPLRPGTITDHVPGNYSRELGRPITQADRSIGGAIIIIIVGTTANNIAIALVVIFCGYQRQLNGYLFAVSVHVIVAIGGRGGRNYGSASVRRGRNYFGRCQ